MAADQNVIDKLTINIGINAAGASQKLKGLAGSLQQTGQAAGTAKSNMQDFADSEKQTGEAADKANPGIKQTATAVKQAGMAAKTSSGFFGTLVKSMGRIAFYRLIRSAIKAVTTAVIEGTQTFIEWDTKYNGGMAGAQKTIDELKNKWTQLKKTIGATIMPILQTLQPILVGMMNIVIKVLEYIQQIVRALRGESTWYKAIYRDAKSTTKEAQKLQRVLFGFDELNVLPSKNNSSEEASVGQWDYVKEEIEPWIQTVFGTIGRIVKKIIGYIERIWKKLKDKVIDPVTKWIKDFLADPGAWFEGAVEDVKKFGKDAWEGFKLAIKWDEIKATYEKEGPFKAAAVGLENLGKVAKRVFDFISIASSELFNFLLSPSNWNEKGFKTFTSNVQKAFSEMVTGVLLDSGQIQPAVESQLKGVVKSFDTNGASAEAKFNTHLLKIDTDVVAFNKDSNKYLSENPLIVKVNQPKLDTSPLKKEITTTNKELKKDPISFALDFLTSGLGKNLASIWDKAQKNLNKNPLELAVSAVGSSAVEVMTGAAMNAVKSALSAIKFAEGGVVRNTGNVGTLFVAGEAGPEVVANLGTHTGVMNVDQMQDAVAEGNVEVVNAIYAVLNALNNKDLNVYLDSQKIGQSVTRYQNNQARRGVLV